MYSLHIGRTAFDSKWKDAATLAESLGPRIKDLLLSLLDNSGVKPHSVVYRVKARESAERKIERKADEQYSLANLTDILGLRVITYFPDEVDTVASIVENEFSIDEPNSVDKRKLLDPDRFGYLSLHYIAQLSGPRRKSFGG